jgi:predicted O-methyltransferase YrrM
MAEYTSDWFSYAIENFKLIKNSAMGNHHPQPGFVNTILEIGSHEGRSACWMLENLLSDTGTLTCVDPFANSPITPFKDETYMVDREVFARFQANVTEAKKPQQTVDIMRGLSYYALADLIAQRKTFDFIYVDGSHQADATLTDACMCFGLLNPTGFMLFDDYLWNHVPNVLDRGKMSIDAFVNMFLPNIDIVNINYQFLIQKKKV